MNIAVSRISAFLAILALALIPVSMFLLWKDKKAQELAPRTDAP